MKRDYQLIAALIALAVILFAIVILASGCAAPARSRLFIAVIEQYPAAGANLEERDVYVVHYLLDGIPYEASVRGVASKTAIVEYLKGYAR